MAGRKIKNTEYVEIINRQYGEIESLKKAIDNYESCLESVKTIRIKAIKEFAERLKTEIADALKSNYRAKTEHIENIEKHYKCLSCDLLAMIRGKIEALRGIDDYIDNLVKEMEEQNV